MTVLFAVIPMAVVFICSVTAMAHTPRVLRQGKAPWRTAIALAVGITAIQIPLILDREVATGTTFGIFINGIYTFVYVICGSHWHNLRNAENGGWSAFASRTSDLRRMLAAITLCLLAQVGWTMLLIETVYPLAAEQTPAEKPWVILNALLVVSVYEEIVYRLGITGLLWYLLGESRLARWTAILLPNLIWMAFHTAPEESMLVYRYLQILPLGLFCSFLMIRFGIEAAIALHVLFNLAMFGLLGTF